MTHAINEIARLKRELAKVRPEAVQKRAAQAVETLEHLQTVSDPETAHEQADRCLCSLLRDIGLKEVADEFEAVERWYG